MTLYQFLRVIAGFLSRLVIRIQVRGLENIPPDGPLVVAANHIHALDPLLLAIPIKRPLSFMGKEELLKHAFYRWLMPRVGAFPVKRGQIDVHAFRHALEILAAGGALGIFPEGTRSQTGEIQEALGGAVVFAARSGATLLPVAIVGQYRLFGRLRVNIGAAVPLRVAVPRRPSAEERSDGTGRLMEQIHLLKQQAESW